MRKLALALIATACTLLSGCVVYDEPAPRYHHYGYRDGGPGRWDRDHDGVPNRYDRRPDNPYRY